MSKRKAGTAPYDVADARRKAADDTMVIVMTILYDKNGFDGDMISKFWSDVGKLSEEIAEGRVAVKDLKKVLKKEYGVET